MNLEIPTALVALNDSLKTILFSRY